MQVNHLGEVIVRAPTFVAQEEIERFLIKYESWIKQKVRAAQQNPPHSFAAGEEFYYLGKPYPLMFGDSGSHSIKFDNAFIVAEELSSRAKELLISWMQRQALKYLDKRCREIALQYGYEYRRLNLNDASTNWGSCSAHGSLHFNWRLIQCPPEVIDYIIMHELAHLVELNHSSRFWELVEKMCPEHEQCNTWLKRNSSRLKLL